MSREIRQPGAYCFTYSGSHAPIAEVSPGETLVVHTIDAFSNRIRSEADKPSERCHYPEVNPQTGPIAVTGAEPGDVLRVHLHDIRPARDYAVTIRDLALRRDLIRIGAEIQDRALSFDPDNEPSEQITAAEQALYSVAEKGRYEGGFVDFARAIEAAALMAEAAYKRGGRLAGLSSGLTDLDNKLGGFRKSDLVILAGRPSMGKTALATNIAFDIARKYRRGTDAQGNPVAEFSLYKLANAGNIVAGATLAVPLGTLLSEELKLSVDGGKAKSYSYSFCTMAGCFARIGLTQADVDALKRGATATLESVPAQAPDQRVRIDASLNGFTAAYNAASELTN